jgi:transcriptional regulator with XRE-family HTH domain
MNSLPELGRAVAMFRHEKNLTQRELAVQVGLGASTLARFETGGVAEFGAQKLLRLLDALGYEMTFTPANRAFTLDDALAERQRENQAVSVPLSAQAQSHSSVTATLSVGRPKRTKAK